MSSSKAFVLNRLYFENFVRSFLIVLGNIFLGVYMHDTMYFVSNITENGYSSEVKHKIKGYLR